MKKRSRREILKGLGVVAGAAATGCGSSRTRAGASAPGAPFPVPPGDMPSPTPTPVMSPKELLAGVDHLVVLYLENRSFDQFLGSLKLAEGRAIEGLTGTESNPDANGVAVPVWNLDTFTCDDPPHSWDPQHSNWDNGAMDGFYKSNFGSNPTTANQAMGYYLRSQLPTIYELADQFAVCDHWFSALLGPTFPNRLYLHGATSLGLKDNLPLFGFTSIFDVLDGAGIPSKSYFHDLPFCADYLRFTNTFAIEQFFTDAAAGTLPAFTMLDPKYTGADQNDDHPAADVRLGDALMASVYAALSASPCWPRTMFVISFDENGGFYDHLAPPQTIDDQPGFSQLGFRVPSIVIGPMVKQGTVSTVFEHVSPIATLTQRWGLTPMNTRVTVTNDLSACVDPAKVANPQSLHVRPPRISPVEISLGGLADRMRRPHPRTQPELQDLADRGAIPRQFDRRADDQIVRRVLEAGARLGAVRLVS